MKLETTCIIPEKSIVENRAFKTSAREIYLETCLDEILEEDFLKMLEKQEQYNSVGSGYILDKIDRLLLSVNKFTPLGGSSYIVRIVQLYIVF